MPNAPAYEMIKQRLKDDIISGVLNGGDRLTIEDVAKRYNTSCMPAREALKSLQAEGVIEITPRRGARINDVDALQVSNIYDVLIAIEPMITVQAAKKCSADDVDKWFKLCKEYEELVNAGDFKNAYLVNRHLHEIHFERAENEKAREIYLQCYNSLEIVRNKFHTPIQRQIESGQEHYLMAELIRGRAYDALASVVSLHISRTRDLIIESIETFNKQLKK